MWCNVAGAAGVGEEIFNMRSKLRSLGRIMDLRSSSQILRVCLDTAYFAEIENLLLKVL